MTLQKIYDIVEEGLRVNEVPEEELEYYNGAIVEEVFWGKFTQPEGYTIEWVDQNGGEGEGDTYNIILSVEDNETKVKGYIRFNGWYDSWNGTEWLDTELVEPVKVEVTEYHVKVQSND